MKDYAYVKFYKTSKIWHLSRRKAITLCGEPARFIEDWRGSCWGDETLKPQGPLCKRCAKSRGVAER